MLDAITRDALGDPGGAEVALERALDLAERDSALLVFVLFPAPDLLGRHAQHGTAHPALLADIRGVLANEKPALPPSGQQPPLELLSKGEIRVLRFLPTHLSVPEIARQLSLSSNTVRTHVYHLYAKLGVHTRREAVERARALGLLAPSREHPERIRLLRPGRNAASRAAVLLDKSNLFRTEVAIRSENWPVAPRGRWRDGREMP